MHTGDDDFHRSTETFHARMSKSGRKRKRGAPTRKCCNDECLKMLHPRTKICPSCGMDQYNKRMRTTERQTRCEDKPRTISTLPFIPETLKDKGWCHARMSNGEWRIMHKYCSLQPFLNAENVFQHIKSTKDEESPYDIIGVDETVTMKHLKLAWHRKCLETHPDKVLDSHQKNIAKVKFQKVSQA